MDVRLRITKIYLQIIDTGCMRLVPQIRWGRGSLFRCLEHLLLENASIEHFPRVLFSAFPRCFTMEPITGMFYVIPESYIFMPGQYPDRPCCIQPVLCMSPRTFELIHATPRGFPAPRLCCCRSVRRSTEIVPLHT